MSPPRAGVRERGKALLFRAAALALSLVCVLAVGEVVLRIAGYDRAYVNPLGTFHEPDPVVGYRGRPGFSGQFRRPDFDVRIEHDADGFRKQEFRHPPADPSRRVFVFGDSTVWGWGVGQGEGFTDRMSRFLPEHEVVNFGLNGSGTVQQFALFERWVEPRLAPGNVVVVMFCGNDWDDNVHGRLRGEVVDGDIRVVGPRMIRDDRVGRIGDRSYVVNLIVFAVDLAKETLRQGGGAARARELADRERPDLRIAEDSPAYVVTVHFLERFKKACDRAGATLLLSTTGGDTQIAEVGERLGVPTVVLLPTFLAERERGRYDTWLYPRDGHWNAHGHEVAAEELSRAIRRIDAAGDIASPSVQD